MKQLGKLLCALKRHKRGTPVIGTPKTFVCPRCGRVKTYKAKDSATGGGSGGAGRNT